MVRVTHNANKTTKEIIIRMRKKSKFKFRNKNNFSHSNRILCDNLVKENSFAIEELSKIVFVSDY